MLLHRSQKEVNLNMQVKKCIEIIFIQMKMNEADAKYPTSCFLKYEVQNWSHFIFKIKFTISIFIFIMSFQILTKHLIYLNYGKCRSKVVVNYTLHLPCSHGMEEKVEPWLLPQRKVVTIMFSGNVHIFLAFWSYFMKKVGRKGEQRNYKENN